MFNNFNMTKEQFQDYFQTILALELFGVHIEDVKEEIDSYGFPTKITYYYSVPESSTIEIEAEDADRIKTSEGLKLFAKETLTDLILDSWKRAYGDDNEFVEDAKENISDYFKFKAKVRKGEVWNRELGDNMVKKICNDIKQAAEYREV